MNLKAIFSLILVVFASTIFMNAQTEDFDCREEMKVLRDDFYNTNILPQHEVWRAEIKNALSQEDKDLLAQLKTKATTLKTEIRTKMEVIRNSDATRKAKHEAMKALVAEYKDDLKAIYAEIKTIWDKYQAVIDKIKLEKKDLQIKWQTEMKALMDQFCVDHPECCENMHKDWGKNDSLRNDKDSTRKGPGHGKGKGHKLMGEEGCGNKGCGEGFGRGMGNEMGFGKLLGIDREEMEMLHIWLGSAEQTIEAGDQIMGVNDAPANLNLQSSPNPANNSTIITFNLDVATTGRVYVADMSGNVVAELYNGALNAGTQSFSLEAGKLAKGVYFYYVVTSSFVKSNKLVVE